MGASKRYQGNFYVYRKFVYRVKGKLQKLYNFLVVKFCILRQGTGALQTHFFRSILHKTFYLNVSTTFSTLCWRYTMESHFWFVINHDDLVFNSSFMLKREVLTNHLEFQSNGKWIFNFIAFSHDEKCGKKSSGTRELSSSEFPLKDEQIPLWKDFSDFDLNSWQCKRIFLFMYFFSTTREQKK